MRKNIVLFSFDDCIAFWRYKAIFGAELKTPNLDRIRAVSTSFLSAYCQSPLCGPSRASMMTGRSPFDTGILSNLSKPFDVLKPEDIWSYKLKESGYYCSSGGKVHHGYFPLPEDAHAKLYSDERKFFTRDLGVRPDVSATILGGMGGGIATLDPQDDAGYYDAQSALSFTEFLNRYDGEAPFYREVGFFSPHIPFITPMRFKQMYQRGEFTYPAEWDEETIPNGTYSDDVYPNFRTHKKLHWQRSVRNYFSAVSHGDHHLGRVWDALQASSHAKNTIFIISSDHGLHLGEKRRFGKSTMLEQVANVPLIIHDPDHSVRQDIEDPVALIDIGPTALDIAGLSSLKPQLGQSLLPLMRGARPANERAVPTFRTDGATIRKGRYRFTRTAEGKAALYDLVEDWWQRHPMGPEHPAFAELSAAHQEICAAYSQKFM